ncbi:hypothetical protein YPPY01_2830 [Yersinia pestis PY-01]|nr:hypothetical protein YPPY01_2830 [Yersinia pestis PY-01]EIQ89158.1 hypothetical protein YPPY03_2940 [Yersinia pestis PY-03]EIR19251.1 hypothetical protein YPPY09_2940 [Yersinia pestis PY-09]EIR30813.1 hypothetical protein YPPY10_2947 [Yersinia pestis PY-10]EIR59006.1 hypothetical protein YPPY16_2922 [Yersinia pestis PY-16]
MSDKSPLSSGFFLPAIFICTTALRWHSAISTLFITIKNYFYLPQ